MELALGIIVGCVMGFLTHYIITTIKEEKAYKVEMDEVFEINKLQESLGYVYEQETYEKRKEAHTRNKHLQLDVNKIRKDKMNDKVLRAYKEREMIQVINKYKDLLGGRSDA